MNIVLQYSRIFSFLKANFDRVSIVFGLVDTSPNFLKFIWTLR